MRKTTSTAAAPAINVAAALARLPDLIDAVRNAIDNRHEEEEIEANALMAALEPILKKAMRSNDPDLIEFSVRQALVLFAKLEDGPLPMACEDVRQFKNVLQDIADIRALLGVPADRRACNPADPAGSKKAASATQRRTETEIRAGVIFDQITKLAAVVERLGVLLVSINGDDDKDERDVNAYMGGIKALSSQIGLLADFGADMTGSLTLHGPDIGKWLLPPVSQPEAIAIARAMEASHG